MTSLKTMTAACCLVMTSGAAAQNLIHNPSFETVVSSDPEGWGFFNTARLRSVGDGLNPAAVVRTGSNSIEFPSGADFVGATTNVFNPSTLMFFDPEYVWQGGDVTVSGWYYIPSDEPLTANAGIKLEFRRENSSIATAFEELSITGDTNDEWVQFEMTVTDQQMMDAAGDFPPFAVSVSVLPLRFGSAASTGTIFWDDLELTQGSDVCLPDVNGDGMVTPTDFTAWINAFNNNEPECDQNGDGSCSPTDFTAWINNYNNGC
ncbi:MAG: hypothetical protein Phyf2KO_10970 [Phycisphaerales bacterium]